MTSSRVYLSLGSNLGDRAALLRAAIARLASLPGTSLIAESIIRETLPWGNTDQPAFLNMVVALETEMDPQALLAATQQIEQALGRERSEHWGPRTIDIDLLLYAEETRDTSALRLPHPYLTQRRFVLEPLAEIAPELIIQGKSVRQWLAAIS